MNIYDFPNGKDELGSLMITIFRVCAYEDLCIHNARWNLCIIMIT